MDTKKHLFMRRGGFGLSSLLLSFLLTAVTGLAAEPYWIYLKDKGEGRSPRAVSVLPSTVSRREASSISGKATVDDLALHPRYLRIIEISGARIRARSRWLNAVSVRMDSSSVPVFTGLSFVQSVQPVAWQKLEQPGFGIQKKEPIDSTYFGNTYRQLELLNIPKVHELGVFGQGVKMGFLDTGLKRKHTVFKTLRLGGEHDFITGDEIVIWENQNSISALSNYEIVQQPELHGDYLFFIADSTPLNATTRRVLYAASRSGGNWSDPFLISRFTVDQSVTRSYAVSGADSVLVVWESGTEEASAGLERNLRWGILSGGGFEQRSILDTGSRNPYMIDQDATTYLFYVKNDGTVRMDTAFWDGADFSWGTPKDVFTPGGILDRPKAWVTGDTILVAALDLAEGELHIARSQDRGASFVNLASPALSEVVAFDLEQGYLTVAEIDSSGGGFRLHSFQTQDAGESWSKQHTHSEVFEVIASVDLKVTLGGGLHLVFESAGQIYLTSSSGDISSWSDPSPISLPDFCYQPFLSENGGALEAIWSQRGDTDTDYDENEDGIDINDYSQPAHGSRVTALAAGYQGLVYIGTSPGVEVYVAKTEKHVNRYGSSYELRIEEDIWIEGLEWLEKNGVDIVNSSLAYGEWYSNSEIDGKASPSSRAATMAAERGVLVVNSAGNVKSDNPYIKPPADAYGILTVGGVDTLGNWWEQGPGTTGSAVGLPDDDRIKPELVAPANGVYVIDVDDSISFYFYGSGTSYAAPLIAGAAALMLEVHPEYRGNPDTIISLLEQNSTLAAAPNDTLGYGIPDVYAALLPLPDSVDTFSRNELLPPFPNPFYLASQERIYFPFRLNKASPRVIISVFTLSGEKILERPLVPLVANSADEIAVGTYDDTSDLEAMGAYWDGLAESSQPAAAGLYLLVLHTEYGRNVSKFVLVR